MQRLEVSGAVRPIYGSLRVKRLMRDKIGEKSDDQQRTDLMKENEIT